MRPQQTQGRDSGEEQNIALTVAIRTIHDSKRARDNAHTVAVDEALPADDSAFSKACVFVRSTIAYVVLADGDLVGDG